MGPQLRQVGVSEESEERVEEASQTQQERHGHNLLVATCFCLSVCIIVGRSGWHLYLTIHILLEIYILKGPSKIRGKNSISMTCLF